jgi:hypothetical protein
LNLPARLVFFEINENHVVLVDQVFYREEKRRKKRDDWHKGGVNQAVEEDYERVRLMVPKIKDVSVPELRFGTVVSVLVIMPFTVYPNYSFVDDVCEPQKVGHECELDDEL